MKTRRLDNGLLVFDGGTMDGILVHESSDAYIYQASVESASDKSLITSRL